MRWAVAFLKADRRSGCVELPRPDFFVHRKAPIPSPLFATYWRFAKVRQDIFFARLLNPERRKPYIFGAVRDLNFAPCRRKAGNYAESISLSSTRARIFRSGLFRMPSVANSSVNDRK